MPQGEGEKLPVDVVAYRLEVLEAVFAAGDPVERVDAYRHLFERGGFSLTSASHMRQLIPLLARRQLEIDTVELKDKFVSVIFDGTSHFGELLLIIVRYFKDSKFRQRLIKLRHSDSPLDKTLLAFIVDRALLRVGLSGSVVLSFIKDTASVNFAAVELLKRTPGMAYGHSLNMPCFSHGFDRIGRKLKLELAKSFIAAWSSYFSKSMKVLCSLYPATF
jgi:hypothetical protein